MPPLFLGNTLIELASVDSTNDYAKDLLRNERPAEGTIVFAHDQLIGRGQAGNSWSAEKGKNLTLSIILYPKFLEAEKQFFLNMAVSLGGKDFCETVLDEEIKIKWPNDIYNRDNKLAGILIENTINSNKLASSVIGIGININQKEFGKKIPNATSFSLISGHEYQLQSLIEQLASFIEKYYLQLRQMHFNFLDKAYMEALYRYQQTYEFRKGAQHFKGEINGVTKEGKLIIHSKGKEQRFGFKEVEFVI
jgi:BirA family transcriptional regulator, biotin operon repressor / biotin---[acetyl-CoA-carboxylase] ligase